MVNHPPIGTTELCELLGIDKSTVSRWVAAHKLKPIAQLPGKNGAFLFDRHDIEQLVAELRTAS